MILIVQLRENLVGSELLKLEYMIPNIAVIPVAPEKP